MPRRSTDGSNEMKHSLDIFLGTIFLAVCILMIFVFAWDALGKPGAPVSEFTVVAIGDCVQGTNLARCRVTFNTGEKATVFRPVDVGDIVRCRENGRMDEYRCFVK